MPSAREGIIDLTNPGWIHAINRSVRKAYLAGGKLEHRRQWVEDRLASTSGAFACKVAAYAVMSNRVHVVVRMDPVRTEQTDTLLLIRMRTDRHPFNVAALATAIAKSQPNIRRTPYLNIFC